MEGPIHGCFSQGCHGPQPQDFGRPANPIQTKGEADYGHHITTFPPDFQTFLRPIDSFGEYIAFYNFKKHKMSESLPFGVGMIDV